MCGGFVDVILERRLATSSSLSFSLSLSSSRGTGGVLGKGSSGVLGLINGGGTLLGEALVKGTSSGDCLGGEAFTEGTLSGV